jgi:hypothetical protein
MPLAYWIKAEEMEEFNLFRFLKQPAIARGEFHAETMK